METEGIPEQDPADASAERGDDGSVFVCYSHRDADEVYPEITRLRSEGVDVWYDEGITLGAEWTDELASAIEGCRCFLFYATARSVQSRHCRDEVHYALKHNKSIVVVYLDDTDLPRGLDLALNSTQAVRRDAMDPTRYLSRLLQVLSPGNVAAEGVTIAREDKAAYAAETRPKRRMIRVGVAAAMILAIASVLFVQLRNNDPAAKTDPPASSGAEEVDVTALESIAVLPFANMSGDPQLGSLANGVVDAVLDELAQAQQLRVASRTAASQLSSSGAGLQVIAEDLNVSYVLEGSVQRFNDQVRFTAQLIRAKDGYHVWSKTYQRAYADGFEMQTSVAQNIAIILRSKLWSDIRRQHPLAFEELRGVAPEAVGYLLDSEEQWELIRLGEGGDHVHYVQLLEKAVEVDPRFAYAHGELAWCYVFMVDSSLGFKESAAAAHAAIAKAVELGLHPVDALFLSALAHLLSLDYASAEAATIQGMELQPMGQGWPMWLAMIAAAEGRTEEALRLWATASVIPNEDVGNFLRFYASEQLRAGEFERSAKNYAKALDLVESGFFRTELLMGRADALIMLGQVDAAKADIAEARELDTGGILSAGFAHLYAKTGDEEEARRILTKARTNPRNAYEVAMADLALGNIDQVFEVLGAGVAAHNREIASTLRAASTWDAIRDDPRFGEVLELLDAEVKHTPRFLQDHGLATREPS